HDLYSYLSLFNKNSYIYFICYLLIGQLSNWDNLYVVNWHSSILFFGNMSSLTKMLSVLDIFSSENPSWTIEEMAEHLGYAVPTMYRYVKELTKAGLLRNISAARYGLGTRIIELDYQIRNADPLI